MHKSAASKVAVSTHQHCSLLAFLLHTSVGMMRCLYDQADMNSSVRFDLEIHRVFQSGIYAHLILNSHQY